MGKCAAGPRLTLGRIRDKWGYVDMGIRMAGGGGGGSSSGQAGWSVPASGTAGVAKLTNANDTIVYGWALPSLVISKGFVFYVAGADTGNLYSFGLYDSTGKLVCNTTPAPLGAGGLTRFPLAQSMPFSLAAGIYFQAFTGNSTNGGVSYVNGTGEGGPILYASANPVTGGTSSGGALNATVTPPAFMAYQTSDGGLYLVFALY